VSRCDALDIPYVNLYPEFLAFEEEERATLFDEADWHLSVFGNQISGELAASVLVWFIRVPKDPQLAELSKKRSLT